MRKIIVAECEQEISSFNPKLSEYSLFDVLHGDELFAAHEGAETCVRGALDVLRARDDLELQARDDGVESRARVPKTAEELKQAKKHLREQAVVPVERAFALDALRRNNWNVTRAAEETGMLRTNFQAMLRKLNISARERHA